MKIINSLISAMFTKQIQQLAQSKYNEFLRLEDERREQTRRDIAEFSVGNPVICISNQWEDPVIGFVSHIEYITKARDPVPVVMDYLSGQELMVVGAVYDFTQQRLGAFMRLNPYERWAMAQKMGFEHHGKHLSINDLLEMSMNPKKILTEEEVYDKLIETGFLARVEKFMNEQVKNLNLCTKFAGKEQ